MRRLRTEELLLLIVLPFLLACALGGYLFNAQHTFPGVSFKGHRVEL